MGENLVQTVSASLAVRAFVFTFSHIGIVASAAGGLLHTIEGNTNDQGGREGARPAGAKSGHTASSAA